MLFVKRRDMVPKLIGGCYSSSDIDQQITEAEKELQSAIEAKATAEQAYNELSIKILELQIEKKKLGDSVDKAKTNEKLLSSRLRVLRSKYWSVRQEGL